jgi:hypothetical protein
MGARRALLQDHRAQIALLREPGHGVRREKAALPVGASPTRQPLQPEPTGVLLLRCDSLQLAQTGSSPQCSMVPAIEVEADGRRTRPAPPRPTPAMWSTDNRLHFSPSDPLQDPVPLPPMCYVLSRTERP